MRALELPARYEPLAPLGKGGGGEVWAVRDRFTGERHALKVLAPDASEVEMTALVREAVTLSGLEGLGVPRVLRFGRLPGTGRPFMVRELVIGESLQELIDAGAAPERTLEALASAAEQVTLLHRAGLLHGDIKPANVIVQSEGSATLVDLGLSAPWLEAGTMAKGLTPKYAAPELFKGGALTVRAEVYSLGVALADVLAAGRKRLDGDVASALKLVTERSTRGEPAERYPSADEFASALRSAGRLPARGRRAAAAVDLWPIVGIDVTAGRLAKAALALPPGGALRLDGPGGSGRSVLLRRLAWSLGVEGRPLAWLEEGLGKHEEQVRAELSAVVSPLGQMVLVDDAAELPPACVAELQALRARGARLVLAGGGALAADATPFEVPPLGVHASTELVRRAVPSLTEPLVRRVVEACAGRPGELRRFVRVVEEQAIASEADLDELLHGLSGSPTSLLPEEPLDRAVALLDRGRYNDARAALEGVHGGDALAVAIAWARLELGLGEARAAHERLSAVEELAADQDQDQGTTLLGRTWSVYMGRAQVGLGQYAQALALLDVGVKDPGPGPLAAEALAYKGLALGYLDEVGPARAALTDAIDVARALGSRRIEALGEACLGSFLQRSDDTEGARAAFERAITCARDAGDAGVLSTAQLNLAGLLKISGDIAGAIENYEAALDMGKRSGRRATVRQALLNLANNDLYLGRLARARTAIDLLAEQRAQLPPVARAQLLGLEAECLGRSLEIAQATKAYAECADAFHALGLSMDAAEARLEGVLVGARANPPDPAALRSSIGAAEAELAVSGAHRSLLSLAIASVGWVEGDEAGARTAIERALIAARESAQKDWIWRALEARSEIEEATGQPVSARRDREEALSVLEEIAARLPRDLREVFWNDPRRRNLRSQVPAQLTLAATEHAALPVSVLGEGRAQSISSIGVTVSTPLERRLARILEINAELLGEVNIERLAARVTDHAVDMLHAERGFVLLPGKDGELSVHTSRGRVGETQHHEFSRSIAAQVIRTREPVVAVNAKGDARLKGFASVHQLALESVACVPIQSRYGQAIGALYVETRLRPGATFEAELPTLSAFADQVAIALETAELIRQNTERASELAEANTKLEAAQAELKEALGDRTEQLRRTRRKLRDVRDTLYGHFGYQGLVGTSAVMRKLYALIDRVKSADVPVLITGESGTGKEVAARAVHQASPRADKPFFGLNCGAVPEPLLESELFGHVRGAFTGAERERKGLFREADGGTLLLDEIGEMPARMQTSLLRVLQERKVRPVGGSQEQAVDVRLVFATHRDLELLVREGKFREDLFYRIHVVEMHLPPLRDRTDDIPPLVDHFLGLFAARYKRDKRSVSREALRRLAAYAWPGNVRQLEHVLLNAWVLSDEPVLEPEDFDIPDGKTYETSSHHLPVDIAPFVVPVVPVAKPESRPLARGDGKEEKRQTLSRHRRDEKGRILQALEACNWNRVAAAQLSGIPRRTFYRRLREYGIQ